MIFDEHVVVITGAGSGIGRGLAAGFCNDGASVVGIGRTEKDLEETSRSYGRGRMDYVVGDVSKDADVDRLFSKSIELHGKVDILINNAAVYPMHTFLESPAEVWRKAIEINVVGMAMCCQRALPGMLERGYGRIINLGSFAWRKPIPNSSAYSTSKGAVRPLTRAIASEIDRSRYPNVLVNELIPGMVKTRMSETGEDPMDIYSHARFVAELPSGGPTGKTFVQSRLHIEDYGIRARLKRLISKYTGGFLG